MNPVHPTTHHRLATIEHTHRLAHAERMRMAVRGREAGADRRGRSSLTIRQRLVMTATALLGHR